MPRRDLLLIAEMIDAAVEAQRLVAGIELDQLERDRQRRDALLWNFTVLGEAAAQLSAELRAEHSAVPWTRPTQLRNRIVHGYWSIDLGVLHVTATDDLPEYVELLKTVLERLE